MSNSKRILAALLAGAMVLCAGCGKEEETEEESSNSTAVEVTDVTSGAMSSEYTLNGKIAAVNEVQVFPLLAGQVQTLNVSEGDTVSKGQTLFTVDTSTVTSTMSSLQQSYSATKTATDRAIESAKVGVEQAELAVSNTEALLEAGAAAEQDLTKAKQALTQAQAGVAQAEAQQSASLAQIQASMDQINKQASLGTVTAPCSGTVTAVNVDRGGMASSAQPSVVIAENGAVEVQVSVAEDVFTGIKVGDTAGVTVSAVSKESMNGTVSTLPDAKGNLFVQMGILRSQLNIRDLEKLDDTVITGGNFSKTGSGKIKMSKSASVSTEINLLGKTVDEAIMELDKYLDDAYIAHLPSVRIVHGKGTGALRKGVHNYLRRQKHVKSYRLGEFGEGDAGVTIVEFK